MRDDGPALEALALLYANGELEGEEQAGFERRLAADQSARDALCQAVELAATLSGRAPRQPGASYRAAVLDRLRPAGWWGWLSRRRSYRGHPALWAVAGAATAAVLFIAWPGPAPAPPTDVVRTAPQPAADVPTRESPLEVEASVYTELTNFKHLANTVAELKGHRDRLLTKRPSPADGRAPKTAM
jgi:anti-sigma-K factor RskA